MKVVESKQELLKTLQACKDENKTIGFVPTMGALHQGHVSLVEKAIDETDIVVVSIFVNPIQFNDPNDFEKYPSTVDEDIAKLKETNCSIVFIPNVEEMYPEEPEESYDFGYMETVMEGACRPGHFNGVAVVVKRLFNLVQPDVAFFGEKDFQQLAIIKELVRKEQLQIEIVGCPTIREDTGLAMSSRNTRLSENEVQIATCLSFVLRNSISYKYGQNSKEISTKVYEYLDKIEGVDLEYFSIVDKDTLKQLTEEESLNNAVACIAAVVGGVRLIDNMSFTS